MERMQTIKNSFKNNKGFTLVEIGIVLVIIGIILGAVLKGKDLISGARFKKFTQATHLWTLSTYNYLDRFGRFPGDATNTGIIPVAGNVKTDFTNAKFEETPTNPIVIGSFSFYALLGNDGQVPARNVMVICPDSACATTFDAEQIKFIQAFDTSIDGLADGATGIVRCQTAAPQTATYANWTVLTVTSPAAAPAADACAAATTKAMVFYFDRAP
jgi:prepilin-type N-terminal cleavage/methylation domain-containing protein